MESEARGREAVDTVILRNSSSRPHSHPAGSRVEKIGPHQYFVSFVTMCPIVDVEKK